jgi:hypothetical protein
MSRSPLRVHIGGIDEVSAIVEVIIKDYFRITDISAKSEDITSETERVNFEICIRQCDHEGRLAQPFMLI